MQAEEFVHLSHTCLLEIIIIITRLPSNLGLTTCKCMLLVRRDHLVTWHSWWLHHSVDHSCKPYATRHHADFMALCFVESELLPMEVLHCGNSTFFALVTLTLTLIHWLYIQTWPVFPGDIPDVLMWTYYVKAFESYPLIIWQTDRHD